MLCSVPVYDGVVRVSLIGGLTLFLVPTWGVAQNTTPQGLPVECEVDPLKPVQANFASPAVTPVEVPVVVSERGPKVERADWAAYFAGGALAEAKAAFDAGRWATARQKLAAAPDSNPARFLAALAAFRAGDFHFASTAFEALAETYAPLRDRCLVHAGWAFEAALDWQSALRVFASVSPDTRLHVDAQLGLSRMQRVLKDFSAAEATLTELVERPAPSWGRDVGAEALRALFDIHAAHRNAKGEKKALIALWSKHPLAPQASWAAMRLGAPAGVPVDAMVTRAEVLIDAHRNAQGLAVLASVLPRLVMPDAVACRANFATGKAYRKLRQHPKAIELLVRVTQKCTDPDLRARALYTLGLSQMVVAPVVAAETYTTLARAYPQHSFADDGLFFAAEAYLRVGHDELAIERLTELVDGYPTADFAAEALFKLFWVARAQGRWADATDVLSEIERRSAVADDSTEVERAGYWRGRIAEAVGRNDEAVARYIALARAHPASYYGLLAREKVETLDAQLGEVLRKEIAAPAVGVDPFPLIAGPVLRAPQFQSAIELLRLGFQDLVPIEMLSVDRAGLTNDSLRLMVEALAFSKEIRVAHGLARLWLRRDLSGPLTPENRSVWQIAYPRAFRDLIETSSASADALDPDLLQALMREESALDPKALSSAGALGLCQLMPATAAEVAAQLKLSRPTSTALLEPELNIQLGAQYLSGLMMRMKGATPFALASYNAGEGAVRRWRRDHGDADVAEWVENIPVQETRNYVKRVLRNYATYKLLYTPDDLAKTVSPPPESKPQPTLQPRAG